MLNDVYWGRKPTSVNMPTDYYFPQCPGKQSIWSSCCYLAFYSDSSSDNKNAYRNIHPFKLGINAIYNISICNICTRMSLR